MFKNFKHLIIVDVEKFTDPYEPMAWVPCEDARQYFWPARAPGDCAVWRYERVYWSQWEQRWCINTMGDAEMIFVATNNDMDAMMIALKYCS
jgi:hypothetical protein